MVWITLIYFTNATTTTTQPGKFKLKWYGFFPPTSERIHALLASLFLLNFPSSSVLSIFFVLLLTSSFIALYLSISSTTNLNSSSFIKLSIIALDTWLSIVSNFAAANVLIFKCFPPWLLLFCWSNYQSRNTAPVTTPPTDKIKANGAPTPVAIKTAPVPSAPYRNSN